MATMFGIALLMTFASATGCWIVLSIKEHQWIKQANSIIEALNDQNRQDNIKSLYSSNNSTKPE